MSSEISNTGNTHLVFYNTPGGLYDRCWRSIFYHFQRLNICKWIMALAYLGRLTSTFKILACLLFIFLLAHLIRLVHTGRRFNTWDWSACPEGSLFGLSCTTSRAAVARRTQIVVKTGGSEPQSRLHAQLQSTLSGIPESNIIIFSDMDEATDSYHAYDVYANVSAEELAAYPESALYYAQKEYQRQGTDTRSMQGGWDLAK